MPNYTLAKNLNLCFSLLQRPQPQIRSHSPQNHHTLNYNSLYDHRDFPPTRPPPLTATSSAYISAPGSPSSVSTDYMETEDIIEAAVGSTTPDLTAAYASQRFFISSPGRSNSIVDSLSLSSSTLLSPAEENETIISSSSSTTEVVGGVPIQTYSPDPYVDFRQSMQEMVEARDLGRLEVKEAWEYLQELLLSYLALNPKNTHKYIVGAFTDLVVNLMSSPNNNCDSSPISFSSSSCDDHDHHHDHKDDHNGGRYV
ncbi:transcription repressor OFP12-like [Amaranthus tricolor]|uniref:transcription repressor OFP12-like n=1 Tax=Amaranthus tricolor TaxID=29722 RepID=UPI00258B3ACD|nr:transcription repressor OFP12-like [Amaranthus tricolor]